MQEMDARSVRDAELAERLRRARPAGSLGTAIAAAGGVLAVAGAFVLASEADGRWAVNLVAVLLLLAGYALALTGPAWARPASLAAAVIAPLVLVTDLVAGELDGRTAVVLPALLVGAAWLAMFLAPGLRGAPVLVAGALLAGWVAAMGAVASYDPYGSATIFSEQSVGYWDAPVDPFSEGELTLVYGLVVVGAAAVMDRRGWRVLATPFIAVAVFLGFVGLSTLTTWVESVAASAVLVTAVGAIIAVVGGSGRRRGSTWIGSGLAVAGLAALVADLTGNAMEGGVLMLILAAALVAGSQAIERAVAPAAEPDAVTPREPEPF